MIQTNNYEFNIVEGNDIVNPLVQLNPNFTKLDTLLKGIADSGIGTALQVKSGTNHAITKDDDCSVFKFVATADYRTGDTFTLNGDTVTIRCMDGTVPKDRAFVINQNVLMAINGTLLTLIGGAGAIGAIDVEYNNQTSGLTATNAQEAIDELKAEVDAVPVIDNASDVPYDNVSAGLSATNVQGAIDEVNAKVDRGSVSVSSDGSKTFATLLNELYALIDMTKVSIHSKLAVGGYLFTRYTTNLTFTGTSTSSSTLDTRTITIGSNNSVYYEGVIGATGFTSYDISTIVAPVGTTITLYY